MALESRLGSRIVLGCSTAWAGRGATLAREKIFRRLWCRHISRGRTGICQHGAFSGIAVIVASFVPAECPKGGGMWGIFGKPLKRAIRNTLGLHVVLTVCLRFLSFLDSACVACWLFLSTDSHHVRIQVHATCQKSNGMLTSQQMVSGQCL